ncbi:MULTISPECIES: hypothetical protein [unclassified Campylobacter]|uniref:hypothetical protein n=1 Tax=unclassified Campylobacter TaxID=2593542 RepID=UPI0022E9C9BA|nr:MULTISPECIES: hypothetical protein [unclassified Campylobacter]MDA3080041.1 hypothetical protein [Campylobacter sp. CS_NA2]MDA3081741.1 hypothetical protein [Campylobacter sp. CS_NA1]MDA3086098.1 hypothetical protein [Campylobacter sp. CS_ED1]MDA3090953.1 hypothetical protein [Campylobacter sp. CS_ED2]WBR51221.1 hypothetical protein PF026_07755 [Campylobacter sp. CS_NA3]
MKKILVFCVVLAFAFGGEFTAVKFSPEQTEKMMKELHSRLEKCQTDERTKKLISDLEDAFYPLEDMDFSHDYDPSVLEKLRRLNMQNQRFLTHFVLTSGCKLD